MLAVLNLPGRTLLRFELAPPVPTRDVEAELRWILEDWPARHDHLWDLEFHSAKLLLLKLYYEARDAGALERVVPIIETFRQYGPSVPFASHVARENLDSDRLELRLVCTYALGSFGDLTAADLLWREASAPHPAVRWAALASLAKLGDPATHARLKAAAAGDPDLLEAADLGVERRRGLELSHGEGDHEGEENYVRLSLSNPVLWDDLLGLARYLFPQFMPTLTDETLPLEVRRRGFQTLATTRTQSKAVANLAVRLACSEAEPLALRLDCVRYLGRTRVQGAAASLMALVGSPHASLQEATIVALGKIGNPLPLGVLLNYYGDREGAVRALTEAAVRDMAAPLGQESYRAWAAGEQELAPDTIYVFKDSELETAPPLAALRALLRDGDPLVRREAGLLLGLLGDAALAPALQQAAGLEPDELTRAVMDRAARLTAARAPAPRA